MISKSLSWMALLVALAYGVLAVAAVGADTDLWTRLVGFGALALIGLVWAVLSWTLGKSPSWTPWGWKPFARPVSVPGSGVLVQPRGAALWTLVFGLMGLLLVPVALFEPSDSLWHRLWMGSWGVLWTLGLGGLALHWATWKAWDEGAHLALASFWGTKTVVWSQVAKIEDQTTRFVHWDKTLQRNTSDLSRPKSRQYLLQDASGRTLARLSHDVPGIGDLIRSKTALIPSPTSQEQES